MAGLHLQHVTKQFGATTAVDGVDLEVASGEFFSLLGPSGCGKSTTLRLIAGLEHPDAGRVVINDVDVTELPPNRRPIGMVFQSYALFPHLTVAGNVGYGLRARRVPRHEQPARIAEALEQVALGGFEGRRVGELSGGQQQRVAIARALVLRPRLLLLDEPLSNLDARLRVDTRAMLRKLQQQVGITTVYVTHDQEEALVLSDRMAVMHHGRVLQVGPPGEVYHRPAGREVATFIGRANLKPVTVAEVAGGVAQVRLTDSLTVAVADGADAAVGQARLLCVRPEAVRLSSPPHATGVIVAATFNGPWFEYEVDWGGGRWLVSEPNLGQPARQCGHRVGIEVPAGAGALLPVDKDL